MKKAMILAGTILLFTTTTSANAAPMQWADNGHWYDVVWVDAGLSWEDARDLATQNGSHLATPTTAEENAFIWSFLNANLPAGTQYHSYWLGATSQTSLPSPSGTGPG